VDRYLQVVFDHRRNPSNAKCLPTLAVLEGTTMGPGCSNNGPGVEQMLKICTANPAEHMSSKKYCDNLRRIRMAPRRRVNTAPSTNPMGDFLPAEAATYYEAESQELRLNLTAPPQTALPMGDLSRISSQPSGIFQQTELDVEVTMMQSSSVPLLPRVLPQEREIATMAADAGNLEVQDLTSLEVLPPRPASQGGLRAKASQSTSVGLTSQTSGTIVSQGLQRSHRPTVTRPKRPVAAERQTTMMKAFARAVAKKSVLVLTEKTDVRKAIMRSLLAAGVELCFVKTSTATWQRLQDPKETFHALIWDLTKSAVAVDGLLKNIRASQRYGRLPIIVLSNDQELSETVRIACSYVVFHPVAPSMLREALLWCFDRRTLTGLASKQESVMPSDPLDMMLTPATNAWS